MELVPRQKVAWSKRKKPKISIKRGNPIRVRVKYREKDRSHKIKQNNWTGQTPSFICQSNLYSSMVHCSQIQLAIMPRHRHIAFLGCTLLILVIFADVSESSFDDRSSSSSHAHPSHQHVSSHLEGKSAITSSGILDGTNVPKLNSSCVPAFLIIDVQNCFLPGGAIPVPNGDSVIPVINKIRQEYFFRSIVR